MSAVAFSENENVSLKCQVEDLVDRDSKGFEFEEDLKIKTEDLKAAFEENNEEIDVYNERLDQGMDLILEVLISHSNF